MKNTGGALSFDATINDADFKRTIKSMEWQLSKLTKTAKDSANDLDSAFSRLANRAAVAFAGMQLAQLPMQIVKVRGEFQQLEIALNTMLQSSERGGKLMQEIVKTAATTPFSLQTLAQGTKQMLAYGSTAETVVGELRMLGDVASGVSIPLGDLVYLYGTLRAQGRAYAVDIRQFAGRGIPIYAELAKVLGVNVDQINDLVSAGKVGFPEVEQAFKNMTSAGSMFGGLMEQQSKSIPGLIERLKDSIAIMYNEIGKENQGFIEGTIKLGATMVENYKTIGNTLAVLISVYGGYRAAVAAVFAVDRARLIVMQTIAVQQRLAAASGIALTAAQTRQAAATILLQRAQAALNATMLTNPYVLMGMAVAGLASAIWLLHDASTAQEKAQKALNDQAEQYTNKINEIKSETSSLISVINDENSTQFQKEQAFERLQKIYPLLLENMSLYKFQALSAAEAQKMFNNEIDNMGGINLANQINEARKKLAEYESKLKTLKQSEDDFGIDASSSIKKTNKEIENLRIQIDSLLGKQESYNNQLELSRKAPADLVVYYQELVDKKTEEIKQLEIAYKLADSYQKIFMGISLDTHRQDLAKLVKQLEGASTALNPVKKTPTSTGSSKEKIEPFGSIAYWNQVAKKAKEASEKINPDKDPGKFNALDERRKIAELNAEYAKANLMPYGSLEYWEAIERISQNILKQTPATDTGGIAAQKDIIINAQKQAEEVRKSTAVRSFDQELEYKRQQYELYEKWATKISKDQADSQFKSLIENGQSFSDFLQFEIEKMQGKIDLGEAIDVEQFDKLKEALRVAEFQKTPLEEVELALDKIGSSANSSYEEILQLNKELSKISSTDTSQYANQVRSMITERRSDAYTRMSDDLRSFLQEVAGSEERRTQIQAKYENLRRALSKDSQDGRVKDYRKSLDEINKAEKKELDEDKKEFRFKSNEYKSILKIANKYYKDINALDVQQARFKFKILTAGLDKESAEYKEHYENLIEIEDKFYRNTIEKLNSLSVAADAIGSVLSGIGGNFSTAGSFIQAISGTIRGLSDAIAVLAENEGKVTFKGVSDWITLLVKAISYVVESVKRMNADLKEYFDNYQSFLTQAAIAENKAIGRRDSNPFMSDYKGMVEAGSKQYRDALEQYEKSIEKLEQGSAIVGHKSGLFRAKNKKNVLADLLETYPQLVDQAGNFNKELAQALISTNQVDDATKVLLENTIAWYDQMAEANAQMIDSITSITGMIGNELADAMVNAFKAGEDGAKAMSDVLSGIVENFIKQSVLLEIFRPALDEFTKGVKESYAPGGDGSIVDNLQKLNSTLPSLYAIGSEIMKSAHEEGLKHGMNIFGGEDKGTGQDKTLSGAIKGMSQETASVLAGQFNAIRIYQAQMATDMRVSVSHLSVIANNTSYNSNLTLLNDIRDEINGLRKDMKGRAFG